MQLKYQLFSVHIFAHQRWILTSSFYLKLISCGKRCADENPGFFQFFAIISLQTELSRYVSSHVVKFTFIWKFSEVNVSFQVESIFRVNSACTDHRWWIATNWMNQTADWGVHGVTPFSWYVFFSPVFDFCYERPMRRSPSCSLFTIIFEWCKGW